MAFKNYPYLKKILCTVKKFQIYLSNTNLLNTLIWFQELQAVIWFQVTNKKYYLKIQLQVTILNSNHLYTAIFFQEFLSNMNYFQTDLFGS